MKHLLKLLFLAIVFCFGNELQAQKPLKIAVASNLTLPLQEIIQLFEAKYHVKIQMISASSGVLTAQIQQGAPYSIFLSANTFYPNKLYQKGYGTKPKIVTSGRLAIWSKQKFEFKNFTQFIDNQNIKSIGIALPRTAPYGKKALKILQKNRNFSRIKPKLVYGQNVGQVNQYIRSQAVDVALTAGSAMRSKLKNVGFWQLLPESIPHSAILLKYGSKNQPKTAQDFYNFLFSDSAQKVFKYYFYK